MISEIPDVVVKDGEVVAVDLETYDPDLKKHGSGAILGKGFVVGIALAYGDDKFYFPLNHKEDKTGYPPNHVWKHLNKKNISKRKSHKSISQCNVRRMLDKSSYKEDGKRTYR